MTSIIQNATPPVASVRGRKARFPFADLQVGDGFDIESGPDAAVTSRRLYAAAYAHRRKHNATYDFIIGISPDDEKAVRLVRTA